MTTLTNTHRFSILDL